MDEANQFEFPPEWEKPEAYDAMTAHDRALQLGLDFTGASLNRAGEYHSLPTPTVELPLWLIDEIRGALQADASLLAQSALKHLEEVFKL